MPVGLVREDGGLISMEREHVATLLNRAEQLCRARGDRLTRQRRAVLELLCASDKPLSAYELLELMREHVRKPAPPTVYRALDFLLDQGLVHKLESLHAFVGCTHPDRPHVSQFLICADCGEVAELENENIEQSLRTVAETAGFRTERPVVELLGTCAQCAGKHPDAS